MSRLLRLTDAIALLALGLLFGVVAVNVLGRALYDASGHAVNLMIPGAIEISRYALMVLVFAALPRAAAAGMVRVDLLIEHLPSHLEVLLDRLWALAIAGIGAALAWLLLAEAWLQAGRGDLTQDLGLPLWPLTGFAGLAAAVLAFSGLRLMIRGRR